ncbi:AraC family transcriptional regulator [Streptomyces lavendulae]|uniref:AraC family transcriptional regulator n=1 Tax=Streptomyces lavendulae TaxID=1914 RepID=UPI0036B7E7FE
MRNVPLARVDHLPAEVLPIATDYPPDTLLAWHEHRRAQFLYAATGTMLVETDDGAWTVPGERAVLIPPRTRHRVRMLDTQTSSLYIEPSAAPWWPTACRVVEVPPLLRELLLAAADLDADYPADPRGSAVVALILLETAALSEVPLHVPLPHDQPFSRLCRDYLAHPDLAVTNTDWARTAAMSERVFTRRFRQLTGASPAAWRSRARLLASIPLLRHRTVTEVATLLGYASPAAFSYAFARAFGVPPSSMRHR